MDQFIKLATDHPIVAIIILLITALTSKYAWTYFTKKDINITNYKIAELDFKNQIDNAFSAIGNIKRECENNNNEIDLQQKRLNTFDVKIESFEDKLSDFEKRYDNLKDMIDELKDETNNKFKRYDKKIKNNHEET
jgi:chromosome segregation ATPase